MALAPPASVTATVISSSRINLTWIKAAFYNQILIYRDIDDAGAYTLLDTIEGSLGYYEDSDLVKETKYCYKLKAWRFFPKPFTESAFSDPPACGTTLAELVAPTLVVATPISDIEIDLTFKDNSETELWHRVQRKLDAGAYATVVDLEPNREFFRDGALFLLDDASYVDCVPTDIGKQVQDDGGEIGLLIEYDNTRRRWLIDSNGHTIANAESMTITGGTGEGTAARETTGLIKARDYTYKVHAMREEGDLDSYALESAQVTTISEPAAPTLDDILATDTKDKSIRIRWSDVANETGYRIEGKKTADLPFGEAEEELLAVVGIEVTDFLATGLDVDTEYSFRVRMYNAAGNGDFSATKAATTDVAYIPTEFEKWIRNPNIEPVYLAEIYTKMDLTGFEQVDESVTWKKTIGASDRGIDILEVFEDGTAYTAAELVEGELEDANTFYFDYDNRILYVHATDDADPADYLIEGAFWLYFSTHKDIEFTANGRLNHFLPFLSKEDIPDITQEIKPYFEGSFSISSGSIAFKNGTKFFDKIFSTYTWINGKVILKAGREDFTYAQFKEIFTAYINDKNCNDTKITFQLRDMRKEMGQTLVLNKFTVTAYPDIEDTYIGRPIPITFGSREDLIPIPIDMYNQKFKFNDTGAVQSGTFKLRSASVEGVKRNDMPQKEDVHYYVDLQRSRITFDRDGAFIIVENVNDKIDFDEGDGELTAQLTKGTYTTAELLVEIKTKMEAANERTFTITCSGAPERKFTIAANAEFSLLWKTGTNGKDGTGQSMGPLIGFVDDEDGEGKDSYEADEDVITISRGDIIKISFTGFVNSAGEVIENGAEIFKYLMNHHKSILDSELNLDSIYAAKYANENELVLSIEAETSFDEIVRTIEHSIEAYTFQDEFGRLGIKPAQTAVASNVKYVLSGHTFAHSQKKDRSSLYWKVNVYYNRDFDDNWLVKTATDNKIYWKYKITEELPIYTYINAYDASALATSILSLLNKERIESELPMLLFDVMAGDLIKFSRVRFYDSDGTASEITLKIIRISKSPASGRTSIIAEVKA